MNDSSNPGEPKWPRDFDFREAYAQQRELLAGTAGAALTDSFPEGSQSDEQ